MPERFGLVDTVIVEDHVNFACWVLSDYVLQGLDELNSPLSVEDAMNEGPADEHVAAQTGFDIGSVTVNSDKALGGVWALEQLWE